jgi:hypothetical protein
VLLLSSVCGNVLAQAPSSDRYVALVIGNGRFDGALALTQPAADAAAMARRLRSRGFQLITASGGQCAEGEPRTDLDHSTLNAAIACFVTAAEKASQAVFYFSGHSMVLDGRNYLFPVGVAATAGPPASELVDLGSVLDGLEKAKVELSVVMLDASRGAIKDLAPSHPGLDRVAATSRARIVAYSAPVGQWAEEGTSSERRPWRAGTAATEGDKPGGNPPDADAALSAYTRRLTRTLDVDLDLRSLGETGFAVVSILQQSSDPGGRGRERAGELTIENVAAPDMLGRLPPIGRSTCEFLKWRAEQLGNCIEIAAAYESCGKDSVLRGRLEKACPADFSTLVRETLLTSLAGAMKAKTCAALTGVVDKFAAESAVAQLREFKELRSLAQYTCGLEAREQAKARFAAVMSARNCQQTRRFLSESGSFLEADARDKMEKLRKEVCCPEFALGKECLARKAVVARVTSLLERKGCTTGGTAEAKATRAVNLIGGINAGFAQKVDLLAGGATLDQIWTRLEALQKDDCLCRKAAPGACSAEVPAPASVSTQRTAAAPAEPAPQPPAPAAPAPRSVPPIPSTPSATSMATAAFFLAENRDIPGQDIADSGIVTGIETADIGGCTEVCQSNPSCVAVSFNRWKGRCFLKHTLAPSVLDARSTIAVKKPQALPSQSSTSIQVQIARNARFNGENVRRRRVADFGACRSACVEDTRCAAFTFLKSVRGENCELSASTGGYVRDSAADGGFKHQQP